MSGAATTVASTMAATARVNNGVVYREVTRLAFLPAHRRVLAQRK
jgi:hypothetical protein